MAADTPEPRSTTAHAREVGCELRRARKRSTTTGVDVCDDLGWSTAKLSKIESGARGASNWDIATLLGRYISDRVTRDHLLTLTSEPDTSRFMRHHGDGLPESLTVVAIHERMATAITSFDPVIIPSLVQSADYARELLRFSAIDDGELETLVEARMNRRDELLHGPSAPRIAVYVTETAVRTVLGGHAVMRDQLASLAIMTGAGNITIRVIPSSAIHESLRHGGTHLELRNLPAVVYAETDQMTVVYDDPELVKRWDRKQRRVEELALSPAESVEVLLGWTEVYDRCPPHAHVTRQRSVSHPS